MTNSVNAGIVTKGLQLYFDTGNPNSYKGNATTNHAYVTNARIDSAYTPYVYTTSGTWWAHHSDAITVYNDNGDNISAYVNTGVGDWTNTYHGIWSYDDELQRPVVVLRDKDGAQWKAKTFSVPSPTGLGLAAGGKYTISWLQWTDVAGSGANTGLYGPDTNGTYNFHDGLQMPANTKLRTWQRVYATYTVSAVRNMSVGLGCYMYCYGYGGITKIADVQVEALPYPTSFSKSQTRTLTQSFVDLTNQRTLTPANILYNSDGTMLYNGSSTIITSESLTINWASGITFDVWVNSADLQSRAQGALQFVGSGSQGATNYTDIYFPGNGRVRWEVIANYPNGNLTTTSYSNNTPLLNNTWYHICCTASSTGASTIYINGVADGSSTFTSPILGSTTSQIKIGEYGGYFSGKIGLVRVYNKTLSALEVKQNFSAHRGRYGV